jgi:anti-sigma B factor antagonist
MDGPAGIPVSRLADGTVVVALFGEVVFEGIAPVRQAIVDAVRDGTPPRVVVDLQDVTLMDSSGLSALVAGLKAASALGIDYSVRNANPYLLTQLAVTGLLGILNHAVSERRTTVTADDET